MRYVKLANLKPGSILEKDIFDSHGVLLLNKGVVLNDNIIRKLNNIGYSGVVITEKVFENEDYYNSFVSYELKYKIADTVSKMKTNGSDANEADQYFQVAKQLISELVDEIMFQDKIKLNLLDLKLFDDYTFFHSVNVAIIALILGYSMGLNKEELHDLGISSILHDIGKVLIDPNILNKPGKLSQKEFDTVRNHSRYGYDILKQTDMFDDYIYKSVLSHHEKHDGSGYPNGLKDSQIPIYAKIISIADVYDALTSKRIYRDEVFYGEVIEYIMSNSSIMFDPNITKAFLKSIHPFPVGTKVLLSNGKSGYVRQINSEYPLRPQIVLEDSNELIDLSKEKSFLNVTIVNIL